MTRQFAVSIAFALLLCGCGDSPDPASLANTKFNKGNGFVEPEDWDTAIASYSEAIRLKPDDPDFYNNRGVTHQKNGDQSKADADFAKAKELRAKK
jgi:Tfp pilus assembly protein PilF